MRQLGILSLIACLAAASGCNLCCWGKRNAELTGPTDIRKSQEWCLGEDAIFHQPMGPSRDNYGMKPTCWREWPANGGACADGSCGPVLHPGFPMHQPEIAPHFNELPQEAMPPGNLPQGINPFRDDLQATPVPSASGAKRAAPSIIETARSPKRAEAQTLYSRPTVPPRNSTSARPQPKQNKIPPRFVTVPAAPSAPNQMMRQALPAAPAAPAKRPDRLKITVSDAIDTPQKTLAPVAAPGAILHTVSPAVASPNQTKATLASLERMIDVPPAPKNSDGAQPAVIRNDFAAPAEPFRLATRNSLPQNTQDPEVARQTLSALSDMMSDSAADADNQ
ncbi:MAG: hypothetical protein AB7G28_08660 [Pirellulales bacterium]